MKIATKFVSALDADQELALQHLMDTAKSKRVRQRAHSILLSSRATPINEIAQIYKAHRDTVSSWLDRWEASRIAGLSDQPRSGGPRKLSEQEQKQAEELLHTYPNSPKRALAQLAEDTGKTISHSTLKRIAKRAGLSWKRVRKSLKSKRDEQAFEAAKSEIEGFKKKRCVEKLTWFIMTRLAFLSILASPMLGKPLGKPSRYPLPEENASTCWDFSTRIMT